MALTREQKAEIVEQTTQLLKQSKLTVYAHYPGTSVKDMQQLRQRASHDGTIVRVVKNRLFKRALAAAELSTAATGLTLNGQTLYAFNTDDEVAPARQLASFSKDISPLELVGGLTADGQVLAVEDIQALASLPSREELRGRLVGMLAAPLGSVAGVMSANVRSILNVLDARAATLSK